MDLTLLISKISINKKNGKSESINYTLLDEKRTHEEKKLLTYPVELTIWLITI